MVAIPSTPSRRLHGRRACRARRCGRGGRHLFAGTGRSCRRLRRSRARHQLHRSARRSWESSWSAPRSSPAPCSPGRWRMPPWREPRRDPAGPTRRSSGLAEHPTSTPKPAPTGRLRTRHHGPHPTRSALLNAPPRCSPRRASPTGSGPTPAFCCTKPGSLGAARILELDAAENDAAASSASKLEWWGARAADISLRMAGRRGRHGRGELRSVADRGAGQRTCRNRRARPRAGSGRRTRGAGRQRRNGEEPAI